MAQTFNSLMTSTLGYDSYIAQGGDWWGNIQLPRLSSLISLPCHPYQYPDDASSRWPADSRRDQGEEQFKEDQIMEGWLPHATSDKTADTELCDDGQSGRCCRLDFGEDEFMVGYGWR